MKRAIKSRTAVRRCGMGLAVLLLATAVGCNRSPRRTGSGQSEIEKPHLKVGLAVPASTFLPIYVAVDEGLFAQEGIEAELLAFRGGMDLIKAVVSDSVDVGVVSLVEVTAGIDAGQPLKAFYAGFNMPEFDWYAVPPIKALSDAKGKRFGVSQYGTSTDFLTRYALAASGMDPAKDVQIMQGGDSSIRLAAMQAGQIDVNVLASPEKFIAAARGYNLILRQRSLAPDYPYHVFVANESFLANAPKTLQAFLRGHVRGVRLARKDKQRAMQSLIKHLHIDPKYVGPTYDDLINYIYEDGRLPSEAALKLFFDMGIRGGRYKEQWPRQKYWTTAYVETFDQWKPALAPTPASTSPEFQP